MEKALAYYQAGNLEQAYQSIQDVLKATPNQVDALYLCAIICAKSKHFEKANAYFQQAIRINPNRAEFYGNYANALIDQNKIEKALSFCQKAIKINPHQAEIFNTQGNAFIKAGETEKAIDSFQQALALNEGYFVAYNNLGNALVAANQKDKAMTCYQQAIKIKPNYIEALNNLGHLFQENGEIEKANACYKEVLSNHPHHKNAQRNLTEVSAVWSSPVPGKRITLRVCQEKDANYLWQCYQKPDFINRYNRFISKHLSCTQIANKLRKGSDKHAYQTKSVDWVILNEEGQSIGLASLADIQFQHFKAELLVGIPNKNDRSYHAGLETTLLIMDYFFNQLHFEKLTSYVYGDNETAQKNTLALGMVQESYLRNHLYIQDISKFIDLYGNGLISENFFHNKRLSKLSLRLLKRNITKGRQRII